MFICFYVREKSNFCLFYIDDEEEGLSLTLVPCGNCGRNFNQESLVMIFLKVFQSILSVCNNITFQKLFPDF